VGDDDDRELFVATLGEACTMSRWEVFAWVLMSNHYHLVLRTPQANLVVGMTWFQNAFTHRNSDQPPIPASRYEISERFLESSFLPGSGGGFGNLITKLIPASIFMQILSLFSTFREYRKKLD